MPGDGGHALARAGQQHADLALGAAEPAVATAVEECDALAAFEFEHQPQRGGLARALGTEQRGDQAGPGVEGQIQ